MKLKDKSNGVEPPLGSWVYASTGDCPTRVLYRRDASAWVDAHGCREVWSALVDPIDTLPPSLA